MRNCSARSRWSAPARCCRSRACSAPTGAAASRTPHLDRSRMTATRLIPSLGVSDIDRSRDFYRRFFGLELVDSFEDEDAGRMVWCWLRAGGAELMLQQLAADQQIRLNPAIGQSWVVYLRVDDLDGVHRQLSQGGFPASDIAPTQYDTREFHVQDPDGYDLWVSAPVSDDGDPRD